MVKVSIISSFDNSLTFFCTPLLILKFPNSLNIPDSTGPSNETSTYIFVLEITIILLNFVQNFLF